ncbi:MAG TPA: hypothetical protein VIH99_02495 [Bdellovibrionota bacterium]
MKTMVLLSAMTLFASPLSFARENLDPKASKSVITQGHCDGCDCCDNGHCGNGGCDDCDCCDNGHCDDGCDCCDGHN